MNISLSRALSLLVVAAACVRAWWIPSGILIVTLVSVPILALIWFPEEIDDLTFGAWYQGAQVDRHTPGIAVAALGWLFLLLFVLFLFLARFPSK
ncbi:MAG TPA: hypothetical protein VNV61_16260 [Steroidobacteraceae bacterium]|jgi:hypothetical protein|nr:hypothetical protein [Steroidobacteraceae bacterium]